jgi:hypothetical protein
MPTEIRSCGLVLSNGRRLPGALAAAGDAVQASGAAAGADCSLFWEQPITALRGQDSKTAQTSDGSRASRPAAAGRVFEAHIPGLGGRISEQAVHRPICRVCASGF